MPSEEGIASVPSSDPAEGIPLAENREETRDGPSDALARRRLPATRCDRAMPADVRAADGRARMRILGASSWPLSGLQDAQRTRGTGRPVDAVAAAGLVGRVPGAFPDVGAPAGGIALKERHPERLRVRIVRDAGDGA
jgi:hypothetical protein